jgi:hypothetical protein
MKPPSYDPPTQLEWAHANATVIKQDGDPILIGIRKEIEKNGVPYSQTVWMTIGQFRGICIDHG